MGNTSGHLASFKYCAPSVHSPLCSPRPWSYVPSPTAKSLAVRKPVTGGIFWREYSLTWGSVNSLPTSFDLKSSGVFRDSHGTFLPAAPGLQSTHSSVLCSSRAYNRPGISSKCPSLSSSCQYTMVPLGGPQATGPVGSSYLSGTNGRGLCQRGTCEQGLPCSCRGLPRHEATAALSRGASAGNVALGGAWHTQVWGATEVVARRLPGLLPSQAQSWAAGQRTGRLPGL